MLETPAPFWITRLCLQRGLAFIYLIGFLIIVNQFCGLVGEKGLLPTGSFLKTVHFWDAPSLFWVSPTDHAFLLGGWIGVALSLFALTGYSEAFGIVVSALTWFCLWLLYLSYVNFGQTFYGYGWETLLCECGFLAIFLGSADTTTPKLMIFLFRWVLFRLMFGAGMIKLRGDPCWRDLSCMIYHYETQPLPNPLSWYLHHLPRWMHQGSVLFTHFVEVVVPWGYFLPQPISGIAGVFTILFQGTLMASGNLSWLNAITIVISFACFEDSFLGKILPVTGPMLFPTLSWMRLSTLGLLTTAVAYLSLDPIRNLLSEAQAMNASFNSLHLVNTYGAFGSVTKERREVILEGTSDSEISENTQWKEYAFKAKVGDPNRCPSWITPYHYKLDWQMWFASLSTYHSQPWLLSLIAKGLSNDPTLLNLMAENPFPNEPPHFIRGSLYRYWFTDSSESGWWRREKIGSYLPPLSLKDPQFQDFLKRLRE